jgi:Kef-type K+ transport system membrane component KefB
VPRLVNLSVTLVLLFGLTLVASAAPPAPFRGSDLAILMGFLLLVANVGGNLATEARLPRLTGYLVVGIVAGPSVLGLLTEGTVEEFRLIDQFALGLIAMLAGAELRLEQLKRALAAIGATTLAVTVVAWLGVGLSVLVLRPFIPFLADQPLSMAIGVALLLGVWAANSSPDATVAVIEEVKSSGPLTDVILGVTIVKDLLVIVLFSVTLAVVGPMVQPDAAAHGGLVTGLIQEVGGALAVGAGLGWVLARYLESRGGRSPLAIFLFAYLLVVLHEALHVELLLMGASAGFVVENYSEAGKWLLGGIRSVSTVVFAFFFALAGAGLQLGAFKEFWLAAIVIFVARAVLTYGGARLGMRLAAADPDLRARTWKGLISQGGVSLGLLILLAERFPAVGEDVVALGMAVVIGNILAGPVLLKAALTEGSDASGEGAPEGA